MCSLIIVNNWQYEISTPRQFREYFKSDPVGWDGKLEDCCLCQINIEESLDKLRIKYSYDAWHKKYSAKLIYWYAITSFAMVLLVINLFLFPISLISLLKKKNA